MEVLPSKSCKSGNADDKDDADVDVDVDISVISVTFSNSDVDVEKVCYYFTKLSYQPIPENSPAQLSNHLDNFGFCCTLGAFSKPLRNMFQ